MCINNILNDKLLRKQTFNSVFTRKENFCFFQRGMILYIFHGCQDFQTALFSVQSLFLQFYLKEISYLEAETVFVSAQGACFYFHLCIMLLLIERSVKWLNEARCDTPHTRVASWEFMLHYLKSQGVFGYIV